MTDPCYKGVRESVMVEKLADLHRDDMQRRHEGGSDIWIDRSQA